VVALMGARGLHVAPRALSLWSGVVKRIATEASQQIMTGCADVLGSRGVLRDGPWAIYQKVRRDEAVVRHIDTSPVANLRLVAAQLPTPRSVAAGLTPEDAEHLRTIFDLSATLPDYDPRGLDLATRDRDIVAAGLAGSAAAVRERLLPSADEAIDVEATEQPDLAAAERALQLIAMLERALDDALASVPELRRELGQRYSSSVQLLELAGLVCDLHAACACVHLWRFSSQVGLFGEPPFSARWLATVLGLLLGDSAANARHDPVESLLRLHRQGRAFAAVPIELAESFTTRSAEEPISADEPIQIDDIHRDARTGVLT
jgi:hypothetical protein